jgi:hypothetical protein
MPSPRCLQAEQNSAIDRLRVAVKASTGLELGIGHNQGPPLSIEGALVGWIELGLVSPGVKNFSIAGEHPFLTRLGNFPSFESKAKIIAPCRDQAKLRLTSAGIQPNRRRIRVSTTERTIDVTIGK